VVINAQEILNLFRFIDWIMILPDELEKKLIKEICDYEEEIKMPYVTSAERFGIEKGLQQGLQQGLQNSIKKLLLKGFKPDEFADLLEVDASVVQDVVSTLRNENFIS